MIGVGGDGGVTGRDGTGEEIRERGKVCRHTEGLARRPKRITEFVFSWTITGAVPSSPFSRLLSSSLSVPLLSRPPSPARPGPRLFQFLSPERNAMATLRGTKFRRKFLRKSPLSPVALFNPTHVSILGREVSPPARRCPFRSGPRHSGRECFYYRGST